MQIVYNADRQCVIPYPITYGLSFLVIFMSKLVIYVHFLSFEATYGFQGYVTDLHHKS